MADGPARQPTFLGPRRPAAEGQSQLRVTSSANADRFASDLITEAPRDVALHGRLLFGQAQAVLVGLAGCTPAWAARSLRVTAEQLGLRPGDVAEYFLTQRYVLTKGAISSDVDGDAVVGRLLLAARGADPADGAREHHDEETHANLRELVYRATSRETARLDAVRQFDILDTPPDGAFDRITVLAARLLNAPISVISIVDADRVWFKSHHGLDLTQVDRLPGLCASAIWSDQPWVIEDAATDPRAARHPLVGGDLGLRFYAGVPLVTPDGHGVGTLSVMDKKPRVVTDAELATLGDLAAFVMDELALRLSARRETALESGRRHQAEEIASTLQTSLLPRDLPVVPGLSIAARYHVANRGQVGGDFYDVIPTEQGCAIVVGDVSGKGWAAAVLTSAARWTLRSHLVDAWTPSSALTRLNQVLIEAYDDPEKYCTVALAQVRPRAHGGADLALALGGHPYPLILRRDGRIEPVGTTDPALGWIPGVRYSQTAVFLGSGESLVMFSDGLIEALQHNDVDDDRVHALLSGHQYYASAERIAAIIDGELGGPLRDDAAFLVIHVD
jgi:phosphoserine phosphatase RsbU/P